MNGDFSVRYAGEKDHSIFSEWFDAHGSKAPPIAGLPPDCYIAEMDGEPILTVSFYLCLGVGIAYVDWICGKPGAKIWQLVKAWQTALQFFWSNHGGPYTCIRGMMDAELCKVARRIGATIDSRQTHEILIQYAPS